MCQVKLWCWIFIFEAFIYEASWVNYGQYKIYYNQFYSQMSICYLDNCNKLDFVMRNYLLCVWCVCVSACLCECTCYAHVYRNHRGWLFSESLDLPVSVSPTLELQVCITEPYTLVWILGIKPSHTLLTLLSPSHNEFFLTLAYYWLIC